MDFKFVVLFLFLCALSFLHTGVSEHHKKHKFVIHVPIHIKEHKHVHTILKHIHHHHQPIVKKEEKIIKVPHHIADEETHEHFHHHYKHEDSHED